MKRAVFLVLPLILFLLPLSAGYYSSNALGQKKGSVSSIAESEWVLDVNGNEEILYHNGEEYSRKTYSSSGWTKKSPGREETVIKNNSGNVERRIIVTSSGTEEYNYLYNNNVLTGYNYSLNGELVEKVEYVTTSDGILLYYRLKDEGVYLTDRYFVYEGGERVSIGAKEEDVPLLSSTSDDGGYSETVGERTFYYDSNGRLVREEERETEITYSYNEDGTLSEKSETGTDGKTVTAYTPDGIVIRRYTDEDVLLSERQTREDGTIEERRFVGGEARYVFIYDADGKRIKEAYAL